MPETQLTLDCSNRFLLPSHLYTSNASFILDDTLSKLRFLITFETALDSQDYQEKRNESHGLKFCYNYLADYRHRLVTAHEEQT